VEVGRNKALLLDIGE